MKSYATIKSLRVTLVVLVCASACSTKPRREVRERYANGKEEVVRTYSNGRDTNSYELEEFYASGAQRVKGYVRGDTAHLKSYYENGQVEADWLEVSGLEHGLIQCWHPNGQLKKIGSLSMGKPIGKEQRWYDDGSKEYEATYTDGMSTGQTHYWSRTGRYVSRTYHNDTLSGPSQEIDSLGRRIEGQYVGGLEEGIWAWTDSTGKLVGTTNYHRGEIVK
jgi:antitoxin component YwqK of YwqJK toxin-antitoxin module